VIEIPEGTFSFDRSLTLNTDGVTIRGAGIDRTILSFKGQEQGAEGLLVNASDFTLEDLAIEDTVGDALKVNEGRNVVLRRVRAEWTNGPSQENGSYGLYPVQIENLLVEECVAIGASDAGIYVGQSRGVVVRNNRAEYNVAGIEIENTVGADVYGNVATNNTGGILVFNMPSIPMEGHSTRVYGNKIANNNTGNFAPEGTAVASVPAGSGVVINSNDRVEVFDNDITDHQTANVIIASYFSTGYFGEREEAEEYDPYPETVYIYGNRYSGGGNQPDGADLEALRVAAFGAEGSLPNIIWDGFTNPEKTEAGVLMPAYALCVREEQAQLFSVDGPGGYAAPGFIESASTCEHPKLEPVQLQPPLAETT
jgi:parallel beta-helix repeat protein